ncbi:putative protease Do-like 14 [Porphyridium purpureum]|uniref:Putative protease Do-like 14 n=1 Tax=Porphyridium purpureum TaxID=35688 RepID=A0A5J4YQZ5_PORPP|nr:putative protease Do-like 14 [Porphyridium purpureum]KAA8499417.1 putative protease Do-like 14 [Porphyridium purpureum]|eukprot:POR3880..scf295_1
MMFRRLQQSWRATAACAVAAAGGYVAGGSRNVLDSESSRRVRPFPVSVEGTGSGAAFSAVSDEALRRAELRHADRSIHVPQMLSPPPAVSSPPVSGAPLGRYTIAEAIDRAGPAVVNITSAAADESLFGLFGPRVPGALSSGSGFIIDGVKGTVLTNAHVVVSAKRSGNPVSVSLRDGRSFEGIIRSVDTTADIAVVELVREPPDVQDPNSPVPLPSVELGDSTKLRMGEWVVALGSPLTLKNSASLGIISATEREGYEIGLVGGAHAFIQTDAAINVGNSGGPLVDLDGKVVGISTMKAADSDGISFALPINYAKEVIQQLEQYGSVRRPYLGCKLLTLHRVLADELARKSFNFPREIDKEWASKNADELGVLVHEVEPNGPMAKSGIMPGDIVVQVGKKKIMNTSQFLAELGHKVEMDVAIVVIRGKDARRLEFTLHPDIRK